MRTCRGRILATLTVATTLALTATASANHTTINWKGQDWRISHNASAATVGDTVELTRTTGTADATLSVTDLLPTSGGSSYVNANGTPWVKVTYEDNALWRGVDFFVDSNAGAASPRLQAGSLFNCEGLGYTRYTDGVAIEEFAFTQPAGCDPAPAPGTGGPFRVAGDVHTIYVGERADGTVDYNYDGQWFTSTLLRDNTGPFPYSDVLLRLRADQGTVARFVDFEAGDDHPGAPTSTDACRKGGWATLVMPSFKNQGDCMSYVVTGGQH